MSHAGRPRHDGPRTPSGALSRAASAYQDDKPGILIRMRRYGLGYDDARDARAGEALGRLVLSGRIGAELEIVALWYRALVRRYRQAIKAPDALRRGDGKRVSLEITPAYESWAIEAVEAHQELTQWLKLAQLQDRHHRLALALDRIVLEDEDAPALVPSLEAALLALEPYFARRWFA
jgi:hypothetical protein